MTGGRHRLRALATLLLLWWRSRSLAAGKTITSVQGVG